MFPLFGFNDFDSFIYNTYVLKIRLYFLIDIFFCMRVFYRKSFFKKLGDAI